MRIYSEQHELPCMNEMREIIRKALEESLPECKINEWFISSVYFANMLDKIIQNIWNNVGVSVSG